MDLRGKGEELHVDINEWVQSKRTEMSFRNKWGYGLRDIVRNNFMPAFAEAVANLSDNIQKAKKITIDVERKIALFCEVFNK